MPEAPLLDASSSCDYRDLSADERREINAIARAIHERRVILDHVYRQRLVTPHQMALVEAAARDVGALPNAGTPSSPLVGDHEEHGVRAFRDALQACKLWAQGRAPEAARYRDRALVHDAARCVAQRGLDERARRHTGREFKSEVFSVRQNLGDGQFRQSYVRLVVVWGETGDELIVANARELQELAAFEVGADGWRDLARWILDVSHPEGCATRVRRPDDVGQLILRERKAGDGGTPKLRSYIQVR